jgi:hypothetical protein
MHPSSSVIAFSRLHLHHITSCYPVVKITIAFIAVTIAS